ncbi:MAG: hypothetical protein ACK5BV_09295 [Bacteroidota bacterium]|jgi:hypothetical protein
MKRNENIEKELKAISSEVANLPFVSTHTIPTGYFEGLENQIMGKIKNETISDSLDAKDEMKQLSPVLSAIIHKNTYQVEPHYFQKNEARLNGIPNYKMAPVIQLPIRKRMIKLAVAASFIGLIVSLFYFSYQNNHHHDVVKNGLKIQTSEDFDRYLATVGEEEILAYLDRHYLPSDHDEIGGFVDVSNLPDEVEYFEEAVLKDVILSNN